MPGVDRTTSSLWETPGVRTVLIAGAAMMIVASACTGTNDGAVDAVSVGRTAVAPSSTDAPTSTTTTLPPTTTTTTTTLAPPLDFDGEARALRTTTDVVLPVLETRPEGWLVRTPCQELALVTNGTPLDRVHVVVDAGHGGFEPGAVSDEGISEASLNFEVATLVELQLRRHGIASTLTRYADYRVPLVTRVEIAERLEAALLVSVHHQGTDPNVPRSDTPGTEIYYQQTSEESKRFAGLLREEALVELGAFEVESWFAGTDAGATYRPNAATGEDFYGMVRTPTMPAVLAEMSFMGNPEELALLQTRAFIAAEAQAITNAIVRWFSTDDPGSGFVEPSFGLRSSGGGGGLSGCTDPDLGETAELPADVTPDGVGEDSESG